MLILIAATSCSGPQPLGRAIDPADERAYLDMVAGGADTPGAAFLRDEADRLGISFDEARRRDEALDGAGNPFEARRDSSAVSRGAVIYRHECASCHGESADGRGAMLPIPMPSMDFHRAGVRFAVTLHGGAPKRWFRTIRDGTVAEVESEDGTPLRIEMPAYEGRLSNEQVWLVVTYLQSLDADMPEERRGAAE
jgi:mono/diheme cytochrome c family protein